MSQFERFGKYILLEKLASGGMAEIYLAKSLGAQGINKFLAVKRILPQFCELPEFKEMFREEANVSVNLRHSNVVPIFDFGEERNQLYLVMDYVEGRNLRQILNELKKQQVQFSVEQICYVIREAAAGLDHAHRCIDGSTGRPLNIIHRDISPQNIMVSYEGEVKIIDFGIAKAATQIEATKAGTLKGKFGYMSPEQSEGHELDVRTDIFALGIVLWELLANDRLFTGSSEAAILRKIRECQIPPIRKINPNVSPELEKIVNKVLAKDPSLRYQTASALHKDLNRFLNTLYPDFNAQDFAIFIKNAFSQAYQESKRKLVEYSNARDAQSLPENEKPPIPPAGSALRESTVIDHAGPAEGALAIDTSTNIKVDLGNLRKGTATNVQTNTRTGMTAIKRPTYQASVANSGDPLTPWLVRGGLLLIVVVGGWWTYKSGLLRSFTNPAPKVVTRSAEPIEGSAEPASKAQFKVTISSRPIGARISFECEQQPQPTPYMFELEGNKPVHVSLQKEGYYPYEIDFTPVKNAQSLEADMQPLNRASYVTVRLINGGGNPLVEINGKKVCSNNLDLYPIPAGLPVQIRARNPFTGAMAEQTVTLQADQKKAIELILGAN